MGARLARPGPEPRAPDTSRTARTNDANGRCQPQRRWRGSRRKDRESLATTINKLRACLSHGGRRTATRVVREWASAGNPSIWPRSPMRGCGPSRLRCLDELTHPQRCFFAEIGVEAAAPSCGPDGIPAPSIIARRARRPRKQGESGRQAPHDVGNRSR